MKPSTAIFEAYKIRRIFDEKAETWNFSVTDIIQVLLQQPDSQAARKYWKKLKGQLKKEGSDSVANCRRLKLKAADGRNYLTEVAGPETMLRIIQTVPSPKAEPMKLWLAKAGYEIMQDMIDPEKSLDRARGYWKQRGRSEEWIQQRMTGQETQNKLMEYWKGHEIKEEKEYEILTNIIHREWSDISVKKHKELKGIKNQNLRDHMSEAELVFTALAELSTRQIAESVNATGMKQNKIACKKGGVISKNARKELESETGRKIITEENFFSTNSEKPLPENMNK